MSAKLALACAAAALAACSATSNRPAPPRVADPAFAAPKAVEPAPAPGAAVRVAEVGAGEVAGARGPGNSPGTAAGAEGPGATGSGAPSADPRGPAVQGAGILAEGIPAEGVPAEGAGSATPPASPSAAAGARRATDELAVATVAGTRIELAELLGSWLRRDGAGMRELLDDLVLSRIVELEAARFGATLPRGAVERMLERRRTALEAEAQKAGAPDLETFLRRRLMLTADEFFGGLAREIAVDLLASRVVRAWLLTTEHAEVRVIAVSTPEARDRAAAKLAAGTPFADVATELSEDESREQGGRVPPVVRSDSPLARLAFVTPAGEVAGPFEQGGKWLFLRVDARPRPLAGGWDVLGEAVEASLTARPIEDPEYWQWQAAMDAVYEVDLAPFRTLLRGAR